MKVIWCIILVIATIVDILIPDPIPFIDEIILTLTSMAI